MRATAGSKFHGAYYVSATFIGIKPGRNIRKIPSNHCLGDGRERCGCGYPCTRTDWELSDDEYEVGYVGTLPWPDNGKIEINIIPAGGGKC